MKSEISAHNNTISYGRQWIEDDDIHAVVEVLKASRITQGPKVDAFEKEMAKYCGAKYALAVSSGTAALHLANIAMNVKKNDKVITTPLTFVATSNSVIYAGGIPVFVDIERDSLNIDTQKVEEFVKNDKQVKGIIPVHFGGLPVDLEEIHNIAKEHNLWIIEDACHSLGGSWIDKEGNIHRMGDCSYSDITVFSFHPVKQITTGEGGVILTNSKEKYEIMLSLRSHGQTKSADDMEENHGNWYYEIHSLGYNYRLTDIQAALGSVQLKKNDKWKLRRLEIVSNYDQAFKDLKQITPQLHPIDQDYSYHLYVVRADFRAKLYNFLKERKILTQVHYIPIHYQPYYREKFGYKKGDFPVVEEYYDSALSLPLFPAMTQADQDHVIESVKEFYANQ
ncbi:MAG: UDP-4-amino-4,6-dideoxy-N-acetyl-beta-L-altrosamine transaminase [Proteobacteria bacterium]|nr:UDP-4-amino-4,6-dideoxy-N-acetyl-beta-L-altrosamine transaminase [Pseudomonadota bacterium]